MARIPRVHPADRALVRIQVSAAVLLAAAYGGTWAWLAHLWPFPMWWAVPAAVGAAIVNIGGMMAARTRGEQRARREMDRHRRLQAAYADTVGAVEVMRVDQVLAAAPSTPPDAAEEAICRLLAEIGPGGLPRAAIADRLEERGVSVRPEDLSVWLNRLVASGLIGLSPDGWYSNVQEPAEQAVRVDLRGRQPAPAPPPIRPGARPTNRGPWVMPPPVEPVDRSPQAAAADAPPGMVEPTLTALILEEAASAGSAGIAKHTLRERLVNRGRHLGPGELDATLTELTRRGRLVQPASWSRYRHPQHVQG